ncbi:hypothetical protein BU100_12315 [Staphylococcus xylosus]|jgi:hypothetical protein|uniref:Uncharacterized protein n=3 Tax=Staphylococcus TaxID=1279 RepID=A0A9Q6MUU0_9STAP|nr:MULTISPECIES: hypothetical protein [Staphylococcus]PTG37983.1 hypothetical protein BUY24_11820 [Staphylococcus cohnii]MCD8827805.1 hypothetical protein [Staphylococcus gallinarum]MCD8830406.1 hypothetical protein [Staphylococcus gallinarum]MCD8872662.1 hypothetical protein [Staphylococcus gallinarum]MCE5003659.1 hypothetical protein [Staphylococcus pseudoxylosus]
MDVQGLYTDLNNHINYLTNIDCKDTWDNEEMLSIQGDIAYKLDQIVQNYDSLSKEDARSLLSEIALVNRLLADS